MRKAIQNTVQTAFYSTILFALIVTPQLICAAVGAPVYV